MRVLGERFVQMLMAGLVGLGVMLSPPSLAAEVDKDVEGVIKSLSGRLDALKTDIATVTQQFSALNSDDLNGEIARIGGVLNQLEGIGDYIAADSPLVKSVKRWQTSLTRERANLLAAKDTYGEQVVADTNKQVDLQLKESADYLQQLNVLHDRVAAITADLRKNKNSLALLIRLNNSQRALDGMAKIIKDLNDTITEIEKLTPRLKAVGS